MIKLASYNILAVACQHNNHKNEHLPVKERLPKILKTLKEMATGKYIICLQEVDNAMSEKIIELLEPLGYDFHMVGYAKHGSLIAFPEEYDCVFYGEQRPSELFITEESPIPEYYKIARKKKNILTWVELEHLEFGRSFLVFNYHFPLFVRGRKGAVLHTEVVNAIMKKESLERNNIPYILCCDLNGNMKSPQHKLIEMTNTRNNTKQRSSYTVWSKDPSGRVYKGSLDHIFVSDGVKVQFFCHKMLKNYIPDAEEGSDHIPIFAGLHI